MQKPSEKTFISKKSPTVEVEKASARLPFPPERTMGTD